MSDTDTSGSVPQKQMGKRSFLPTFSSVAFAANTMFCFFMTIIEQRLVSEFCGGCFFSGHRLDL